MNSKLLAACGAALLLAIGAQAQSVDTIISSNLFEPHGLATDGVNLYVSDGGQGNSIFKVGADGVLYPVAGRPGMAGAANGFGVQARFADPQGLAFLQNRLYVADAGNNALRVIDVASNYVSTVANSTNVLSFPAGLATDGTNVYIADYGNGAIQKYDPVQGTFTTVVADGIGWPAAVAVGENGDLWVADAHNSAIYRVTSTGTQLIAGTPGNTGTNDAFNALEARLNGPRGLMWQSGAGLLISDTGNNAIRRLYWNANLDVMGWSLETVAGIAGQAGNTNGLALSSLLNAPIGLTAVPNVTGFCFADSANKAIRRYRENSKPVVPVTPPRIGYVQFVLDPATRTLVTSFVDMTDKTGIFNTTTNLVIAAEVGTKTLYRYGPIPTGAFDDTIPDPAFDGWDVVPYPGDGYSMEQFYEKAPTIISNGPTVRIKAISTQGDRKPSETVHGDFNFACARPTISGLNSADLTLNDITDNAELTYTLSDLNSTNPGLLYGPYAPGTRLSFPITNDQVMVLYAKKEKFLPATPFTNILYESNYVANRLTFGFEANEVGSSYFYGAPGQTFYAPVTLSLMPGQTMYSLQFNVAVTNGNKGYAAKNYTFDSMLLKQIESAYYLIPPMMYDFRERVMTNLLVTNSTAGILGVGWMESYGRTNLYDTKAQDLISYSMAHDYFFQSKYGKVVVGAYRFEIPTNAPINSVYQLELGAASATADGISTPALMQLPTNGNYSSRLSIRQVAVKPTPYLVGSVVPFRWFNAGDFGSNTIQNADVLEVFKAACIGGLNIPGTNSDLFNAMDSAGDYPNAPIGDDKAINNISDGDGRLLVNDVFVTFRRSVDPTLTNYYRYMDAGKRVPIPTNSFLHMPAPMVRLARPAAVQSVADATPRSLRVPGADLQAVPRQTIQVPITAQIQGSAPVRVMMMNVTVQPLDGAPALTTPIGFSEAATLISPNKLSDSQGPNNFSAAWLDSTVAGVSGTNLLGTLSITLPDGLATNGAYLVHFDHLSASPDGLSIFPETVEDTLITLGDRTGSTFNDSIPDTWRLRHFGTVSNILSSASADADGDGASNEHEYLSGTNPLDAQSKFQLLSQGKPDRSSCVLQWPTTANKQYVIEWASSLFSTNWTALSTNLGDGSMQQFVDTNTTESARFYRVHLAP